MKILWLSHLIPYPPKGGVLQRAFHLVREMASRHELDLVAFNQRSLINPLFPANSNPEQIALTELRKYCNLVDIFPIPSEVRPYGKHILALQSLISRDCYNVNWLKSKKFHARVIELTTQKKYDWIHYDTISLAPFLANTDSKLCLDHHNIESHMLDRRAENENNLFKKLYFSYEAKRLLAYEKEKCPNFNLNIVCSDIDGARLNELSPQSRVETIPNGVDIDYFSSGASGAEQIPFNFLFVGTLSWYPNADAVKYIARELWPAIAAALPGATIDIVGANPPQEILAVAERDSCFRVRGFVDDVRPYFDRASVFLCPIRDGGGTKLKILDAMAMGKAIVAHPLACEGISVQHGQNVLLGDSTESLVSAAIMASKDSMLRNNLEKEARRLVEQKYAWSAIGDRYAGLLEALS